MNVPSKIRFTLINGVKTEDVKNSKFLIYAHVCPSGTYIGVTNDPVKRWQEHCSDAFNKNSHNYDDQFRMEIRKYKSNFNHYIIATANFEKTSRNKEASAIKFYEPELNMKKETETEKQNYYYKKIEGQIGIKYFLEKKGRSGTNYSREDKERVTVTGEIYTEFGRKRLRTVNGQKFPAGMNIECSRSERSRFDNGDRVRINVAESKKANGTKYLVSAKTAKLIFVE